MGEETEGWTKLDNNENHNLHSPLNIITEIKTSMKRWVDHVDCFGNYK
jgi:hypothetical protein